ncbi:MAG TPA: COX15/CtaA family protein [Steroidobacteraceae bacterium]|nr:COX15/CtaA family protein [Steroidobacteraceae bacterium]
MTRFLRLLTLLALVLAFVVVVVGAYVRLSDAGLGCPDWPLCYGHPLPADIAHSDALAKAWKEMGHRYLAGTLGLLIMLIALLGWRSRRMPWLGTALLGVVVFQATLGMWTVTMLLRPAIVTGHLLGGMTILALLAWMTLENFSNEPAGRARELRLPALIALAALALQIALGGWVSSNYAALACPDLPLCHGSVLPRMDFANAFHVVRELGRTGEGELLSLDALTAIHWTHRMMALVVVAVVGWAAIRAGRVWRGLGWLLVALVALQFSLGVANVAFSLPLPLATAHNASAALLLLGLLVLNFFAFRCRRPSW